MKILRLSVVLVVLDQITKLFIKGFAIPFLGIHVAGMYPGESHDIIGSLVRLTFVENPGMAFGVDFGDATKLFFSLFSLVASGALLWYLYTLRDGPFVVRLALALILAGAFGNFIDRTFYGVFYGTSPLFHGRVVDFIDVDFFKFTIGRFHLDRWPVFNVADSCVSVGVTLFILTAKKREPAHITTNAPSTVHTPSPDNHAEIRRPDTLANDAV